MQIVWDPAAAEQLKRSHTLLELETIDINGTPTVAYCVLPAEKIVMEMANLENHKTLHQLFVDSFNSQNNQLCRELLPVLRGKFGGELDTFYDEIAKKL